MSKPAPPDLVDKIEALALETGAAADEIEAAAREYAEYQRWVEAELDAAEAEFEAGAPTRDVFEVLDELEAKLEERIRAVHGHNAA